MSISGSRVKGKVDEVAGKTKQAFGEATGNASMANKGAMQEVKGHAEQAWGSVKEAAHDTGTRQTATTGPMTGTGTTSTGHDIRQKVTSTAANVKERVTHAADKRKNK